MCGRYSLDYFDHFADRFELADFDLSSFTPRYNIAPSQVLPVIVSEGENKVQPMRWGLIPAWAKDETIDYKMINARAETLKEKASFRKPLERQRCLVPATGFYEWKKNGKEKQPYYFHLKDEKLFAFAGLYEVWHNNEGKEVKSYTIITTQPNNTVGAVHERMPVILHKEDEQQWLDPDIVESERLLPLLCAFPDTQMDSYPVSPLVNSPAHDTKEITQPINAV